MNCIDESTFTFEAAAEAARQERGEAEPPTPLPPQESEIVYEFT